MIPKKYTTNQMVRGTRGEAQETVIGAEGGQTEKVSLAHGDADLSLRFYSPSRWPSSNSSFPRALPGPVLSSIR